MRVNLITNVIMMTGASHMRMRNMCLSLQGWKQRLAEHNCDDLTQVNNDGMNDNKNDNNYMTGDLVSQQAMRELS